MEDPKNQENEISNQNRGTKNSQVILKSDKGKGRTRPKSKKHPLTNSWPLGKLIFTWLSETIKVAKNTTWTQDMHYDLPTVERVTTHSRRFAENFAKKKDLSRTIWSLYKPYFIEVLIISLILPFYTFSSSVFSSDVIGSLKKKVDLRDPSVLRSIILKLLAVAFINSTSRIIQEFYLFRVNQFSLRIRSAVLGNLQGKIMSFSTLTSEYFTEGNITNLLQVDCKRLTTFFSEFFLAFFNIFMCVIGTVYMSLVVGWKPAAFSIMALNISVMIYCISYCIRAKFTRSMLFHKDNRMAYFRNVLQNIEYIKSRALENFYCVEMFKRREKELIEQKKIVWLMSFGSIVDWISDSLASFAILYYYTYFVGEGENGLEPESFLAAYFILGILKGPLYIWIFKVNRLIGVYVSFKRISRFMASRNVDSSSIQEIEELDGTDYMAGQASGTVCLRIENGFFKWKNDESEFKNADSDKLQEDSELRRTQVRVKRDRGQNPPMKGEQEEDNFEIEGTEDPSKTPDPGYFNKETQNAELMVKMVESEEATTKTEENTQKRLEDEFRLSHINVEIRQGQIVVVFGESSSGKSSLLHAMMGEIVATKGITKVEKRGKIAFLGQSRWIIGDTVKENICLGKKFDLDWMNECLESSQLFHDIQNLNDGLQTVLGDTSDTVSGGQKARIALCRCFYQK